MITVFPARFQDQRGFTAVGAAGAAAAAAANIAAGGCARLIAATPKDGF